MEYIKKLDQKLYDSIYRHNNFAEFEDLWNEIRKYPNYLKEAITVEKDVKSTHKFKAPFIVQSMLLDYDEIDENIYNDLIKTIYDDVEIARTVIDGNLNGGTSFLLMSLWNDDIKLTEEQKEFAVKEALNKLGTRQDKIKTEKFIKRLEDMNISDDVLTKVNINGIEHITGLKSKLIYYNSVLNYFVSDQAHGVGEFDLRYYILRSNSWSKEEKELLLREFWYEDDMYENALNHWELSIIYDPINYIDSPISLLTQSELYKYSYSDLYDLYQDKEITDVIWDEIQFCKLMHKLRPVERSKEITKVKKIDLNSLN